MVLTAILFVVGACTMPYRRPTDPKTASEQLLMSHATEESLDKIDLGIPQGTAITLDTTGLTADQVFLGEVIAGRLGQQGLIVRKSDQEASYRVQLIVQSFGTSRNAKLIGIAGGSSQAGGIGFGIPEVALWKDDRERATVQFYMNIYDAATGRFVRFTPWYKGSASRTRYTLLFVFHWSKSDFNDPE